MVLLLAVVVAVSHLEVAAAVASVVGAADSAVAAVVVEVDSHREGVEVVDSHPEVVVASPQEVVVALGIEVASSLLAVVAAVAPVAQQPQRPPARKSLFATSQPKLKTTNSRRSVMALCT
jgi:hypothetical protein